MAPQGWISEQCQTVASVERAASSWSPEHSRELTLPPDKSWIHPTCLDPVSKNHKIWFSVIGNTWNKLRNIFFEYYNPTIYSWKTQFWQNARDNFDSLVMQSVKTDKFWHPCIVIHYKCICCIHVLQCTCHSFKNSQV